MHVGHILKSKGSTVHTIAQTARIAEAVQMLNGRKIGALVVVGDDGGVVGILSERDIVRHMDADPSALLARAVADCMSRTVITGTRSTSITEVMNQMTRFRIRHLPIVENGELMGIVSIGDVVKRKIEEAEGEAAALKEYIAS